MKSFVISRLSVRNSVHFLIKYDRPLTELLGCKVLKFDCSASNLMGWPVRCNTK